MGENTNVFFIYYWNERFYKYHLCFHLSYITSTIFLIIDKPYDFLDQSIIEHLRYCKFHTNDIDMI